MPTSYYRCGTANIRIKNIPLKLHDRLRRYAREEDCTLCEIILEAIEREVSRREWHKRFSGRPSTQLRISAAQLLQEERRQRDTALYKRHRNR
jgi:hypothetical protein